MVNAMAAGTSPERGALPAGDGGGPWTILDGVLFFLVVLKELVLRR
jgi:hypothetical protein